MKKTILLIPLLISLFMTGCQTSEEESSFSTTELSLNTHSNASQRIKDLVLEEKGKEVEGGHYDYSLKINTNLTLTMDIDLSIIYQEIDGKYNLHYEIDKERNHNMIVSGTFDNIIVNSPLVEQLHPEIVKKFLAIVESLGFFTPSEEGTYTWIEEICADPENWVLTNISEDSYSYKLDLKTGEGFSFVNALRLLVNGEEHGYTFSYEYILSSSN